MLNFKKYIKEEIKKESVLSPIKFLGGFGGNVIGQGLKGLGNIAKGAVKTSGVLGSVTNLAASSAYGVLGNKKLARERLGASYDNIKFAGEGLKNIIIGAIQIGGVASFITPTLRGFQAAAEPLSMGLNKNRNKTQKILGLNSNEETPYIIKEVPNNITEIKKFIEEFYKQTKNKREVKIAKKPENFLKEFVIKASKALEKYNNEELNYKFKFLLETYFSNFELIEIKPGTLLSQIEGKKFDENSLIVQYINYLYKKSLKERIILITNNDKMFIYELKMIYKKYLDKNNSDYQKEEEIILELKDKIKKIVEKFS